MKRLQRISRITLLGLLVAGAGIASAAAADGTAPAAGPSTAATEQQLRDAQKRLDEAADEVAELSMKLNEPGSMRIIRRVRAAAPRPMLGISIVSDSEHDDGGGVRVQSVSPGGPGAQAGLQANDIITSYNGQPLRAGDGKDPARQLLEAIRASKAGEAVALEYRRGDKSARTTITPRMLAPPDDELEFSRLPEILGEGGRALGHLPGMPFMRGNGFGSAELVELSPALGSYFGTDKGLLIVRAPEDARFKLQDGDVLLDIDGRVPTSVGHALQILQSYRPGENIKLHIMRQHKRMEISLAVPEAAGGSESGDRERRRIERRIELDRS